MASWLGRTIVVLGLIATLAVPSAVPQALAKPLHSCPGIHAMGALYGVRGKHVKCGFARHWARRYLKHGQEPAGWACFGRFFEVGNCHKLQGEPLFQFYTQD